MRRSIGTAPRDGKIVILEGDGGTCELAHWSAEARAWVKEDGEISKIKPTHWRPTRRDEYLLQEDDEFLFQKEQKQGGSSDPSTSHQRRPVLFPGRGAPPWPAAAAGVVGSGQVAAPPVIIVEAQTAPVKVEREPHARRRFAFYSLAATIFAASLIGLYFRAELGSHVMPYPAGPNPAVRQQAEADRANSIAARGMPRNSSKLPKRRRLRRPNLSKRNGEARRARPANRQNRSSTSRWR